MHHEMLSVPRMSTVTEIEYSPNKKFFFERGVQLPGCAKVILSVTLPSWLQLCSVTGLSQQVI
jgi:hypothetical protein